MVSEQRSDSHVACCRSTNTSALQPHTDYVVRNLIMQHSSSIFLSSQGRIPPLTLVRAGRLIIAPVFICLRTRARKREQARTCTHALTHDAVVPHDRDAK